jgi:hypothetical protein
MLKNKLIDGIIPEPAWAGLMVKLDPEKLVDRRAKKFFAMGVVHKARSKGRR